MVDRGMELIEAGLPAFPDAPLRAALATDTGRHREHNEDAVGAYHPGDLAPGDAPVELALVVADGVGGHAGGQQASRFVVDAVRDTLGAQTGPIPSLRPWMDRLLQSIHGELLAEAKARGAPSSLGSTATIAVFRGRTMTLAHVGDSRAYRLRNGLLEQLTRDDSWVAEQLRAGVLSDDDPEAMAKKNVLTQCLGIGASLKVQTLDETLSRGDRYLLCSDGLHGVVTDDELRVELAADRAPGDVAARLIDLANERGGPDNISAVVFDVGAPAAYGAVTADAPASPIPAASGPADPGATLDRAPAVAAAAAPAGGPRTHRAGTWVTGLGAALIMVGAGSWMTTQVSARGTAAPAPGAESAPATPAPTGSGPAAPRAATPSAANPDPLSAPAPPPETVPDSTLPDPVRPDSTPPDTLSPVPDSITAAPDTTARPDTLFRPFPREE